MNGTHVAMMESTERSHIQQPHDHNGEKSSYQLATIPLTVAPGAIESYQVDSPMFVP